MKTEDRRKLGKKTRAAGKQFEVRVRKDLSEKGWTVCRFDNNVEFKKVTVDDEGFKYDLQGVVGKLIQAKGKFNPFTKRVMNMSGGFPDFICTQATEYIGMKENKKTLFEVIGVECKMAGKLDKLEKEKCKWLLDNNVFSKILIAKKTKEGRKIKIVYEEFK